MYISNSSTSIAGGADSGAEVLWLVEQLEDVCERWFVAERWSERWVRYESGKESLTSSLSPRSKVRSESGAVAAAVISTRGAVVVSNDGGVVFHSSFSADEGAGALPATRRHVHNDSNSCFGVEADVIIIWSWLSGDASFLISSKMTLQQKKLGPIDSSQDGKKTMMIGQSLVAQSRKKEEFTETSQYQRGIPKKLPQVSCFAQPNRQHSLCRTSSTSQPSSRTIGRQKYTIQHLQGGPQRIQKILWYLPLLLPFEDEDKPKGKRIFSNDIDFWLVQLRIFTKA